MRRLLGFALVVPLLASCGWFGGSAPVAVASSARHVPYWIKVEHLPAKAQRGATLFATVGCTSCHTYAGSGVTNLHAPDLTAIGTRHLGIRFQINHLKCPSCVNPGSPMPRFDALGSTRLRELAIFLESSKGTR
jgi:mono/diheme cytochrome c family protein